ncbi:hypothetical protein ACFL2Q_02760 [Thermodesulfobacteriota bacterium]
MKVKNPVPTTPEEWFDEITEAYGDAREAIPYGRFVDQVITEKDLHHMAPAVCLNFRGLGKSDELLTQATDAALTSYVATRDLVGDVLDIPQMAFAFCYLASHFGLDLLNQEVVQEVMDHVESQKETLIARTS